MIKKRIALIAHDHKKDDLVEWALFNKLRLAECDLYATSTTGGNIPVACNRASADFIFSSPLFFGDYERKLPDLG